MLWHLIAKLVGLLSLRRLGTLGRLLGSVVGKLLRIRRKHALFAMQRASIPDATRAINGVYHSLGTGVFELLWSSSRSAKELLDTVPIDDAQWARVDELLSKGRGLIVATAHCGNWDLLACAVASRVPLAVVSRHLKWHSADEFWQKTRADRGIYQLDSQGAFQRSVALLQQGYAVGFIIDQAPVRDHGVTTCEFLGEIAQVDLAFAMLAQRSQAPIVLACDSRGVDGRHTLHILDAVHPPQRASKRWAIETARRFTRVLDGFVRDHPEQWLWLHRRWKPLAGPSIPMDQ